MPKREWGAAGEGVEGGWELLTLDGIELVAAAPVAPARVRQEEAPVAPRPVAIWCAGCRRRHSGLSRGQPGEERMFRVMRERLAYKQFYCTRGCYDQHMLRLEREDAASRQNGSEEGESNRGDA